MAEKISLSEALLHTTVRIVALVPGGTSTGTGFFFNFKDDGKTSVPAIVTNKHVVAGSDEMELYFSVGDKMGNTPKHMEPLQVRGMRGKWIDHPNPDVDLCILPIAQVVNGFFEAGKPLAYEPLSARLIPDAKQVESFSAIEQITMVGYPNGLWDDVNNLPIVRQGITATPIRYDYHGTKEFLIDSACYPGSSGSPVFVYNEGTYPTRDGIALGSRVFLVGILYAVPVRNVDGIITASTELHVQSQEMLNLGYVIKSERLLEFEPLIDKLV